MRRLLILLLCILLGIAILGWFRWRDSAVPRRPSETATPAVIKLPVNFAQRSFDPANPPADMPPLTGNENAECETNFLSNATANANTRQTDATHGILTVTQVRMTLRLNITIWVPDAASEHVLEHEEGHRQISEYYYQSADKLAERIATKYIGRQLDVTGTDLDAESKKLLQQLAAEITAEYGKELNPEPTQLLYDNITDHSRNGVDAKDAVSHALKNVLIESPQPANPN